MSTRSLLFSRLPPSDATARTPGNLLGAIPPGLRRVNCCSCRCGRAPSSRPRRAVWHGSGTWHAARPSSALSRTAERHTHTFYDQVRRQHVQRRGHGAKPEQIGDQLGIRRHPQPHPSPALLVCSLRAKQKLLRRHMQLRIAEHRGTQERLGSRPLGELLKKGED